MSDKFLAVIDGRLHEVRPVQQSAGASDSGKIFALDASGLIDKSAIPLDVASDIGSVVAGEDLSAGDFVNVYYDGSDVRVRPADASASGREAAGFVLDSASAGESVTVYFDGTNDHLSGLTAGELYCLAPTAGTVALRSSVSAVPGNVFQVVGRAISSTAISFDPSPPVVFSSAGVARYMFVDGGVLRDGAAASQSSGSSDAGRIVALGSDGVLDGSLLPDPSIGDNVSGASAGSVLFSGSGGALSQDNSNLFWDASSHRLGVGTATPSSDLDVNGVVSVPGGNSDEWNSAYGWGDHSVAGYLSDISGESISDLSDVDSSASPTDGQIFVYSGGSGWQASDPPVLSIGDDVASGSPGAVLFLDGDSNLAQDAPNLFWDATNKRFGVGTDAPSELLDVSGGSLRLDRTGYANRYGVIYKGGVPFFHDFNYGDNGTVTTEGHNFFAGEGAGNFTMGSTATDSIQSSYNTAIGYIALYNNTTGHKNTAIGARALRDNTTGSSNAAIGYSTLAANTTGSYNQTIGHVSLYRNTTGSYNAAIGFASLYANTTGELNVGVGHYALYQNTTGYSNLAIGSRALYGNTTGHDNVAIGGHAGRLTSDDSLNQTATDSLFFGNNTKAHADGETNQIVLGSDAVGLGSNTVVLGNDDVVTTALKGNVGVGTDSPDSELDVNGGLRCNSVYVYSSFQATDAGAFSFNGAAPSLPQSGYSVDNVSEVRSFDAGSSSVSELANALGTLINDLKAKGMIAE